jgi:hypothetical protein
MDAVGMFVAAALLVATAAYAQYRIRFHTVASRVALLRGVLALLGIVFGAVTTATSGAQGITALFAFIAGFGVVHVPAAIILFLKRLRHEGKS